MITSIHNPKIQNVHKLQAQAKTRREAGAFVIEGVRLAEESLHAGWSAQQVFYSDQLDERGRAVVDGFSARGVSAEQITETVMKAVSETETSQGLLVVLKSDMLPIPSFPNFLLILDGLRDPGNLGTILRTATAAGVQAVLLAPGCADAWSPKVLRAGMGAHFHLPIQSLSWKEIKHILKGPANSLRVCLADSAVGIPYTAADFRSPLALIIGGEASGAGPESTSMADETVHIPMPGGSESLNVGIAASILLFEAVRQRESKL
jgi:TrmH family RNA methyltransferase